MTYDLLKSFKTILALSLSLLKNQSILEADPNLLRKFFAAYEYVASGTVKHVHIGTQDMIADVLTKAIVGSKFICCWFI